MDKELKAEIDAMNYEQMLRLWRFAKCGNEYFVGELGSYFMEKFKKLRLEVGTSEHTRISKLIGWNEK